MADFPPYLLVAPLLAASTCWCVLLVMLKMRWAWAIDVPGERSLHSTPTLRTGGFGLMAGMLAAASVHQTWGSPWPWTETLLACALSCASLVDDRRGLPVTTRLAVHLAAAAAYAFTLPPAAGLTGSTIAMLLVMTLAIVAMTNFYNFMDGANGMAGGMAAIGFGAYAWGAWPIVPALVSMSLALAGAALAFLAFNLRGKIFLGDGGSIPLGFLAAVLGFTGWQAGAWPLWFPAMVFAPFIVDAGVTLVRRIARGENFWQAHRQHYYQRLVQMGFSHARLAVGEYALMLACAGAALLARELDTTGRAAVFATIGGALLTLMLVIDARWKQFTARSD